MYCENCGSKIPEGSEFCTECGKQLSMPGPVEGRRDVFEEAPDSIPEGHVKKERSIVTTIAALAVLIFIAVILYRVFKPQAPVRKAVNALATTLASGTEYEITVKDDDGDTVNTVEGFITFDKKEQLIETSSTEDNESRKYLLVEATRIDEDTIGTASIRKYKNDEREDRGSGDKVKHDMDMDALFKLINEVKGKDVTKVNYDKLLKKVSDDLYDEISDVIEPKNIGKALDAAIKAVEKNSDCIKVKKDGKSYNYKIDISDSIEAITDAIEDYLEDDDFVKVLGLLAKQADGKLELEIEFDGKVAKTVKVKLEDQGTVKVSFKNTGKCKESLKSSVKGYMKKNSDSRVEVVE